MGKTHVAIQAPVLGGHEPARRFSRFDELLVARWEITSELLRYRIEGYRVAAASDGCVFVSSFLRDLTDVLDRLDRRLACERAKYGTSFGSAPMLSQDSKAK